MVLLVLQSCLVFGVKIDSRLLLGNMLAMSLLLLPKIIW